MFDTTFVTQACPTCGRHLQIKLDYLDELVACEHCRATFIAEVDAPRRPFAACNEWEDPLLDRIDQLLLEPAVAEDELSWR